MIWIYVGGTYLSSLFCCLQCDICLLAVSVWDVPAAMSCLHRFCSACWERYLTVRIQEGDAHHILCPATDCHILVPPELIEKLVSPEVARKYLQFDIKVLAKAEVQIVGVFLQRELLYNIQYIKLMV